MCLCTVSKPNDDDRPIPSRPHRPVSVQRESQTYVQRVVPVRTESQTYRAVVPVHTERTSTIVTAAHPISRSREHIQRISHASIVTESSGRHTPRTSAVRIHNPRPSSYVLASSSSSSDPSRSTSPTGPRRRAPRDDESPTTNLPMIIHAPTPPSRHSPLPSHRPSPRTSQRVFEHDGRISHASIISHSSRRSGRSGRSSRTEHRRHNSSGAFIVPPPASDLIGGESMGRSQSDRGPDLERKQRGSASGYVKRHVSVTSAGRRSPSRERTSDARVFLSTPLSEREIRKVSAGLAESARQMNPIEQEEYEMSLRGEGSVISGDGRRERTRSITYGQGPRISRGRIVEDGRERVVITDGEGRRREYYQTAERVR